MLNSLYALLNLYEVYIKFSCKCVKQNVYQFAIIQKIKKKRKKKKECLKVSKLHKMMPSVQPSYRNKNFLNTSKKLLKNRNQIFPVMRFFTWKLDLVSNILWMIVGVWCLQRAICGFLYWHCHNSNLAPKGGFSPGLLQYNDHALK